MARPFQRPRTLMREHELTNDMLGDAIGCTGTTVSRKLNAHHPWNTDEMWKIMDIFNQPSSMLHVIFSRNGQNEFARSEGDERKLAPALHALTAEHERKRCR